MPRRDQGHVQHAARLIVRFFIHLGKVKRALRGVVDDQRLAGSINFPGHPLVDRKANLFHALAGIQVVEDGLPEKKLFFLLIQQNHHRTLDLQEFPDFARDEFQAGVEGPELVHGLGDAEQGLVDAARCAFPGSRPAG